MKKRLFAGILGALLVFGVVMTGCTHNEEEIVQTPGFSVASSYSTDGIRVTIGYQDSGSYFIIYYNDTSTLDSYQYESGITNRRDSGVTSFLFTRNYDSMFEYGQTYYFWVQAVGQNRSSIAGPKSCVYREPD
ncbi:MAG: hypothetical protein LBT01_06870 [Spirochaetaceae bacterium]|jgi:hypothetical protein|nr:hypothetical protein [Spirochaetaceae bacterium]